MGDCQRLCAECVVCVCVCGMCVGVGAVCGDLVCVWGVSVWYVVCGGCVYMWCGVYVEGGYVWLAVCGVWGADMWGGCVCVVYMCGVCIRQGKESRPWIPGLRRAS